MNQNEPTISTYDLSDEGGQKTGTWHWSKIVRRPTKTETYYTIIISAAYTLNAEGIMTNSYVTLSMLWQEWDERGNLRDVSIGDVAWWVESEIKQEARYMVERAMEWIAAQV